jgi:hypothetical protein
MIRKVLVVLKRLTLSACASRFAFTANSAVGVTHRVKREPAQRSRGVYWLIPIYLIGFITLHIAQ